MDSRWNPDEIARTSDESAVRERFDRRNRVWLIVLLVGFTFTGFLEVVTNTATNNVLDVLVGIANFGLMAAALLAFWSKRTRHWMSRRIPGLAIALVTAQYGLMMAFARDGQNWIPLVTSFPWAILGFRMLTSELVLIHAILTGGGVFIAIAGPRPEGYGGFWVAIVVVNAMVLGLNLFLSRRLRRRIVAEWGLQRAQAREQIRMRDELRYARELQLSMLPECAPDIGWLDICATSVPATEVGGDYYDYFVEDGRVALVCGDVAGHGMAAGLVLSAVRSGFTLLRDALNDPAAVLRRLHDLVAETSRRRMLVTVSVALLDRDRQRATIASAGHPPVLLRRANGTVETIDLWAAPLGVRLPVEIPQRSLEFSPGDVFVLHSDGVYEARNAAGEVYGLERLAEALRAAPAEPSAEILGAVVTDVARFRGDAEIDDDMTVVVARVR